MSAAWQKMFHECATFWRATRAITGGLQMVNGREAEVLEYILTNLRLMSLKAQECGIGPLIDVLEAAAMEAEYQLTEVFLSPTDGLESSRPELSRKSDKPL
jgi:hypothetical protein